MIKLGRRFCWGRVLQLWKRTLDLVLRGFIREGQLDVTWTDGSTTRYGDGGQPQARAAFKTDEAIKAMVMNPDLAVGEGFVSGDFEIEGDDLDTFFWLVLQNREAGNSFFMRSSRHLRHIKRRLLLRNPIQQAQQNVAHHYDLSAELYDLFLDADRQYSCAYFTDPDLSLDDAQTAKKRHIARKLCLEPGMRVLDIGCGWGGMALTLAEEYGVEVVGVTLSREQHAFARDRIEAAGLSNKVDIRLTDYREVSESFDRIVSVGMFEHVGARHYGEYFSKIDTLLNADGVALVHTIAGLGPARVTSPWITKYIFPGGHIPVMTEIAPHIERTRLMITDLEVWRLHYAETLKHWHDRFMDRADEAEALYDKNFVRMWRYYLKASELTFRHGRQGVFQMQLSRNLGTVPLTRDYINPPKAAGG